MAETKGVTITQGKDGRAAGGDYHEHHNYGFDNLINKKLLSKFFMLLFVHAALTSLLVYVSDKPRNLSVYFELFFTLIVYGYLPLVFILIVVLLPIFNIQIKIEKLIKNWLKRF